MHTHLRYVQHNPGSTANKSTLSAFSCRSLDSWKILGDDRHLSVDWMDGPPAPDAVLEMLSCKCRKSCRAPQCQCAVNGLKCFDLCSLKHCENQPLDSNIDVELELSSGDESDSEDF